MRMQRRPTPTVVVAVSTLSTGFGSVVAFAPGYIATALRADLGLDRWQVGLVITVHFICTAARIDGLGALDRPLGPAPDLCDGPAPRGTRCRSGRRRGDLFRALRGRCPGRDRLCPRQRGHHRGCGQCGDRPEAHGGALRSDRRRSCGRCDLLRRRPLDREPLELGVGPRWPGCRGRRRGSCRRLGSARRSRGSRRRRRTPPAEGLRLVPGGCVPADLRFAAHVLLVGAVPGGVARRIPRAVRGACGDGDVHRRRGDDRQRVGGRSGRNVPAHPPDCGVRARHRSLERADTRRWNARLSVSRFWVWSGGSRCNSPASAPCRPPSWIGPARRWPGPRR